MPLEECPKRHRYPSDLTDEEWSILSGMMPAPVWIQNLQEPLHHPREFLNAIRYRTRTGAAWRLLPREFPPWSTVQKCYYRWTRSGVLDGVHERLRELVRIVEGRAPDPTAAILDSQSVKATDVGGPRGFDAGKKVNGRKRHLLVDTLGLMLVVLVTPASVQDRDGAVPVLREARREFPTLEHVWADGAYRGEVIDTVADATGLQVEVVKRTDDMKGFVVLPRRWVVERTNGWMGKFRLLSKEYERTIESSRANILHGMVMLMLRRLTTPPDARRERR